METIVLRQHSPVVIPKKTEKREENEMPYVKSKSSGFGWIVAGIVVIIVVLYVIISSIKKDR